MISMPTYLVHYKYLRREETECLRERRKTLIRTTRFGTLHIFTHNNKHRQRKVEEINSIQICPPKVRFKMRA